MQAVKRPQQQQEHVKWLVSADFINIMSLVKKLRVTKSKAKVGKRGIRVK